MRRFSSLSYVFIVLLIIGVLSQITANPSRYIIPIVVIGGIFLLYKYPPNRWNRRTSSHHTRQSSHHTRKRRTKKAKFHVIQGNKRDDDDDTPRYH